MKITKTLDVIYRVLLLLELLKMLELFVVFAIKKNEAVIFVSMAMITMFLTNKKYKKLGLLFVLIVNYTLIFNYAIVNQHFAFLTCLLSIFAIKGLLEKFALAPEEVNKVVSILLIFQLSVLYLFAAIWKINFDYFSGTQMLEHLRSFLVFPSMEQPSYIYLLILSSGGVAIEFLLASQILFRGKVLEFVQTIGVLFHILLVFMLGEDLRNSFQILLFSCAAIAVYPIFNQKYWGTNSPIVFWDSSCSFCGKSINLFKRLDVTENFNYLSNSEVSKYKDVPFDHKIIEETIVVWDQHSGKYWIKSRAITYILTENYFFWFAKPLIYLPFIFRYTDRLYDRVALTRSCNI